MHFFRLLSVSTLSIMLTVLYGQPNTPTFHYAFNIGNTQNERVSDLVIDDSSNVYCHGSFQGTVDFNPDSGFFNLTSSGAASVYVAKYSNLGALVWAKSFSPEFPGALARDQSGNLYFAASTSYNGAYIYKLDPSGNQQWSKQLNGTVSARAITLDKSGNIYVGGSFSGTADFNPGPIIYNLTTNYINDPWAGPIYVSDLFLLKLDPGGNFKWVRKAEGNSYNGINSVACHRDKIFMCGEFSDSIKFGSGSSAIQYTDVGNRDFFVACMDTSGNLQWTRHIGSTGLDNAKSIIVDGNANLYIAGSYSRTIDFDPSTGVYTLQSANNYQTGFYLKLDSIGNFVKARRITASSNMHISDLDLDSQSNLYFTGSFTGTMDVAPGPSVYNLTSYPNRIEYFAGKVDQNDSLIWAANTAGSSFYSSQIASNDNSLIVGGAFHDTADFNPGADTLILKPASWNADAFVYHMVYGCLPTIPDTVHANSCNAFSSPSSNYTWHQSGLYGDTLYSTQGCDSVVMVDLVIKPLDTSVTQSGFNLTSNATQVSYQWVKCDASYTILPADTNQKFSPSIDGDYAVIVSNANCIDTSACISVNGIDLSQVELSDISIYPVPVKNLVTVEIQNNQTSVGYSVYSSQGRLMLRENFPQQKSFNAMISCPKGIYILEVLLSSGKSTYIRIVKD